MPAPVEPDPETLPLPLAVELVELVAHRLSHAATGIIETLEWEDCVRLLDALREATHTIGQVDALLVRQAYLHGPHGQVEVDGVGLVGINRGHDRKNWDHLSLAQAVVDAHLEARHSRGNDENPPPWDVLQWITDAAGFNYWRVTVVRDQLGLPVDEFCEKLPGKLSVQIPRKG
jgi:hypothetical protein